MHRHGNLTYTCYFLGSSLEWQLLQPSNLIYKLFSSPQQSKVFIEGQAFDGIICHLNQGKTGENTSNSSFLDEFPAYLNGIRPNTKFNMEIWAAGRLPFWDVLGIPEDGTLGHRGIQEAHPYLSISERCQPSPPGPRCCHH